MTKRLKWVDKQHQVYALIDPRDNAIRYIGISDDTQYRFYQHLQCIGVGKREKQWMKELRRSGLRPVLRILETIDSRSTACERERYWIQEMLHRGSPLLNDIGVITTYPQHDFTPKLSKVRELRIKAALNVSRLSQLSDVSRPTIEKMENDEPVRADLASAVCRVLSERLGYEVTIEDAKIKVL